MCQGSISLGLPGLNNVSRLWGVRVTWNLSLEGQMNSGLKYRDPYRKWFEV